MPGMKTPPMTTAGDTVRRQSPPAGGLPELCGAKGSSVTSITDPEIDAFLAVGTRTGKLAYVGMDGRPLVTPVWFIVEDGCIVFNTFHNPPRPGRWLAIRGSRCARTWRNRHTPSCRCKEKPSCRAGIIREQVWIQPGPGGDAAVVYLAAAFTIWGASAEPFDRWFRGHLRQVHGTAWDQGFTAPELVLDFGTSRI
jgi:hypothetical protein